MVGASPQPEKSEMIIDGQGDLLFAPQSSTSKDSFLYEAVLSNPTE